MDTAARHRWENLTMNLIRPLIMDDANTEDLSMVPTKEFFKPVLVMVAPLTPENAQLLKCEYLFDHAGNPHEFEGTHKLAGELSGALITLAGKVVEPAEFTTEKVAHLGIFRSEKKGMRVRMRAHLPEIGEADLIKLFRFLSTLNKQGYQLSVSDAQLGLDLQGKGTGGRDDPAHRWPVAGAGGAYSLEKCSRSPFSVKKPKLIADVLTIQVEDDQFLGAWSCEAHFKTAAYNGGRIPNIRDVVYSSRQAAIAAAVRDLWEFHRSILVDGDAEAKALEKLRDYALDLAPELKGKLEVDANVAAS
jgi:hypothetical protein